MAQLFWRVLTKALHFSPITHYLIHVLEGEGADWAEHKVKIMMTMMMNDDYDDDYDDD